ncbi:MAG TPA: hypothetical protein VK658_26800 [Chryseolinea sp.]|nr:hypothetical protein [Chryseolinea sp.]
MIKTFMVVLAIAASSLPGFSQAKITSGAGYEAVETRDTHYFSRSGDILAVKIVEEGKSVVIQKVNATTLKLKSAKTYDDLPKGSEVELVTRVGDKFYVLYSDKEGKTDLLFAREIDFAKGVFKGVGKKIITEEKGIAKVHDPESMNKMKAADKYTFTYSRDSALLAIHYPMKTEHLDYYKDPYAIGMHVFDGNLNRQWESEATLPYIHKRISVFDFGLDTKGNLYMLAQITSDDELQDDNFLLFKFGSDGQAKPMKVTTGSKYLIDALLVGKPDGSMLCAGYFTNSSPLRAYGMATFETKDDGTLTEYRTTDIPSEIRNLHSSADRKAKNITDGDRNFAGLKLKHVELMNDGSIVMVGDQNFIETNAEYTRRANGNGSTSQNWHVAHSNDILITKVDASGKLAWINRLPKRQESYTPDLYAMSFAYVQGNNAHYMFFLDNADNKVLDLKAVPERHINDLGGFLTAYVVSDATGAPSRLSILDTRNVDGTQIAHFAPQRLLVTAPNTIVFECFKKKTGDLFVKIELAK